MSYQLKPGEEIRDGVLYGWTGLDCPWCSDSAHEHSYCLGCGGTGELWGAMPNQPSDLPVESKEDVGK